MGCHLLCNLGIAERENLGRQDPSIGGAGFADGNRGDGYSRGHLDCGQQRIHSLKCAGGNGHADDRQRGFSRNHAGQVGRAARPRDDDFDAASGGVAGKFRGLARRAVRRGDIDLIGNAEAGQRLARLAHDFQVRVAAHHDCNQGFRSHFSPQQIFIFGNFTTDF